MKNSTLLLYRVEMMQQHCANRSALYWCTQLFDCILHQLYYPVFVFSSHVRNSKYSTCPLSAVVVLNDSAPIETCYIIK